MFRNAGWIVMLMAWVHGGTVAPAAEGIRIQRTGHRGWSNSWILGNGVVEAVVVPEVGRVMQFRFAGEKSGPFWENPALLGNPMPADPWSVSHGSFGGDKTWPAPQGAWNWPPPDVFDAEALTSRVEGDALVLSSPVSPKFGIRTERRVTLVPGRPEMTIVTRYEKVAGEPVDVGVWVITQTADPQAVFLPVPPDSKFPAGTATLWGIPQGVLTRREGLLRLTRDPAASHKIGNDGSVILWVGAKEILRLDIDRIPGGRYADDGCSVEVYTNPDPVPYVELETLGPQRRLSVGDTLSATNRYSLFRRGAGDPESAARRVLESEGRKPR